MARTFAEIAFTNSVKAAQDRYGTRNANLGLERAEERRDTLTAREIAFLAERDSFYLGSVGENGWPYVQHRGGPKGFLKVLDETTIGFADFRGNRQYISVGNLSGDDRVALFVMDYPNRRRLKIWARARIVHQAEAPDLIARLTMADYPAHVERGIILAIAAFDWNCPQHITPRFSEAEVERLMIPLIEENRRLRAQLTQARARTSER